MDLTKHLTTRADDGHASPVTGFQKALIGFPKIPWMSSPGKVLRLASLFRSTFFEWDSPFRYYSPDEMSMKL